MNNAKAVHLYNVAHFSPLSPILAAHSVASDVYNCDHIINPHPGKTHCVNCGIMLIPGLTAATRIKYTKKSAAVGLSLRSRTLVVTCGHCSHEHHVCSLINQRKTTVPATTQKKKKKKNSELSAMLAARKSEAAPTLGLFDFMQ